MSISKPYPSEVIFFLIYRKMIHLRHISVYLMVVADQQLSIYQDISEYFRL